MRRPTVRALFTALLLLATFLAACAPHDMNAHTVVISFRDGGAEGGSVDPIKAKVGDTITLPANGFAWKEHVFDGWVLARDEDGEHLDPGTQVVVEDETVYLATWRKQGTSAAKRIDWDYKSTWVELEVSGGDTELVGTMGDWKGKERGGVIRITNKSNRTIGLESKLTFIQKGGHDWLSEQYSSDAMTPGSVRLLHATDLHHSDGLRWRIEVVDSDDWKEPLDEIVKIEEVGAAADQVTVRLTNTGKHVVQINSVRIVATTHDGADYAGDSFTTGQINPGESMEATFETSRLYEYDALESFAGTKRTYYLDGYANLNK